jgi:hypothetical protein
MIIYRSANANHFKESIPGTDTGRYFKIETGTKDLKKAIEIVVKRLFGKNASAEKFLTKAIEFQTDSKIDQKVMADIEKNFKMYSTDAAGSPPYRLVGNSCLDSSMISAGEGGLFLPMPLAQPNLTYDTMLFGSEMMKRNIFQNIGRLLQGKKLIGLKYHDYTHTEDWSK